MTGPAFPSAGTDLMRVTVRDVNEVPLGQLADWMQADVVPRWNGIGAFTIKTALGTPGARLFKAGTNVIISLPEEQSFTGQITDIVKSKEPEDPFGTIEVSGVEDDAILGYRLCLPSPLATIGNQTASATYNATGPAETVARNLARLNIAPGVAVAWRQVPNLEFEPDQSRGGNVSVSLRYDILLEALQRILSPVGLGFSVKAQLAGGYRFSISEARDLSTQIKFSEALGNLNGYHYGLKSPGLTQAIVAGQGEGTARNMQPFTEPTGLLESTWGWRIEQFIDRRDTNVLLDLQQAAAEAFAEQNNLFSLSIDPLDTPERRFGVHYLLGDKVSVEIDDEMYADTITSVRYSSRPGQFRISPVIGNAEAVGGRALDIYRVVKLIATRIGLLEKRF
jgi:Siphovirus ReqiPepy6 Gp37-like protein